MSGFFRVTEEIAGSARARQGPGPLLARKPRKLAAVALANKMARVIWAMMTTGDAYRGNTAA